MEALVALILDSLGIFQCWTVLDEYERGLLMRKGKFIRELEGGKLHWHLPLYLDQVISDNVVSATENMDIQSVTTFDDVGVIVGAIVKWHITDLKKLKLEVEDSDSVLTDCVSALIAEMALANTYDYLQSDEFWHELTKKSRRAVKPYGMHIEEVKFSDLAKVRTLRLIQD